MTKYVRLIWMRDQEGMTEKYNVYRSPTLPVDRSSLKICEVEHPIKPNPMPYKESVTPSNEGVYSLRYNRVIDNSLAVISNGRAVEIEYDKEDGTFEALNESGILEVSYLFDGITVLDKENEGKRFAPPIIDNNSVKPPENIRLKADRNSGELLIDFTKPVSEGKKVFYAIESVNGDSKSHMSEPIPVLLREEIVSYTIQSSFEGSEWKEEGSFTGESWRKVVSKEPPHPVKSLKLTASNNSVKIEWVKSTLDNPAGDGPVYRLGSVSSNGEHSSYSQPVGPISVAAVSSSILIKKIVNGASSTKEERTVAEVNYTGVTSYTETGVSPGDYTYILYVKDKAGNISIGKVSTITI